jgi:hypothetical protein
MAGIFEDLKRDWDHAEHAVREHLPHDGWFSREDPYAASQTPADEPVTVRATTHQEDHMSFAGDIENGYAAVKNELAKFEQELPGLIAKGKELEGNPIAQAAVKLAEAALPPEAVTVVASTVGKLVDDLIGLYNPQGTQAAPAPAA